MRKKKSCDALEWVVSELLSKLTQTMSPLAMLLVYCGQIAPVVRLQQAMIATTSCRTNERSAMTVNCKTSIFQPFLPFIIYTEHSLDLQQTDWSLLWRNKKRPICVYDTIYFSYDGYYCNVFLV